jgi:two-component system, sensor histidine kinase and response regulator
MTLNKKALHESNILIVDDTPANIDVLHTVLKDKGYQIAMAKNGKQALINVSQFKPDLILLDVMMPELDGYETCKRLKSNEQTKDIPIIFITAKAEHEDIVKGFELGAVDYIIKPFQHEEVLFRVKTHTQLRQTVKENKQLVNQLKETISLLNEGQKKDITKSEFFSRMSHDLRAPINAILEHSQSLEQSITIKENNADQNTVAKIINASKHSLALIKSVLESTHIQTSKKR